MPAFAPDWPAAISNMLSRILKQPIFASFAAAYIHIGFHAAFHLLAARRAGRRAAAAARPDAAIDAFISRTFIRFLRFTRDFKKCCQAGSISVTEVPRFSKRGSHGIRPPIFSRITPCAGVIFDDDMTAAGHSVMRARLFRMPPLISDHFARSAPIHARDYLCA